jgi:hypothetical protein
MKKIVLCSVASFVVGVALGAGFVASRVDLDFLAAHPIEYRKLGSSVTLKSPQGEAIALPSGTVFKHSRTYGSEGFAELQFVAPLEGLKKLSTIVPAVEGANRYWVADPSK